MSSIQSHLNSLTTDWSGSRCFVGSHGFAGSRIAAAFAFPPPPPDMR